MWGLLENMAAQFLFGIGIRPLLTPMRRGIRNRIAPKIAEKLDFLMRGTVEVCKKSRLYSISIYCALTLVIETHLPSVAASPLCIQHGHATLLAMPPFKSIKS
jgi:hypothetical protein